ncbi:MFS transporter [Brevibacterium otitidis]|uniref:MFS transporter n=1 Tax=Brevibacterium otitidis TaxID=53364 RepID=A0ABV5X654_9MICO|nr:MFS transporter [Brevibacterium otitidis]
MSHPAPAAARQPLPGEITVLVAAAFTVAIGYGIIAPVLPQFAESFDLGVTAATIVVSSFAFFRFVFAPAGGSLVNALGERRVYITGLLIVAASTFAVALAQSYWQLLIFRGLGGLGSTMFTVSAMALIVRIAPARQRAQASSAYATAFLVGNIAGPVVGGLMAGLGMRVPFIVYAIALVIAAAIVWLRLDATRIDALAARAHHDENAAPASGAEAPDTSRMRFREAWRDTAYRASLLSGFVHGWASMGVRVALYPLFALHVLDAGPSTAGLALTFFALGNFAAVRVVARYSDFRGRKPFILAGLAIMGAATIVLGWSPTVWVFYALSILAGIGAGLLNPAQQAALSDIVGSTRKSGTVFSRYQMAMDAGAIIGPILGGMIVDASGYALAFALTGGLAFIAVIAWLPGRETLPAIRDPHAAEAGPGAKAGGDSSGGGPSGGGPSGGGPADPGQAMTSD